MVSEGATVLAAERSTEETTLGSGALLPLHVDVQDPANVDSMVRAVIERHGRLDCMVNSAGIGSDIPFLCPCRGRRLLSCWADGNIEW
jgi:NADP-dependent 3-hydroxy acid dehydrogenase YdfG